MSDDKKKEQEKGFVKKNTVDPKTAKKNVDKWIANLGKKKSQ